MIAPSASRPSPTAPKYPTNRASVSLSSCLELVPEETIPWKPEMAPHAIVTNSSGTRLGVSSGTLSLSAGAARSGAENRVAP